MDGLLHILSRIISIVLYPMLMPVYGVVLFSVAYNQYINPLLPQIYYIVLVTGTFFFTVLIPLTALVVMRLSGKVTDFFLMDTKERFYPYLYTFLGYCFWTWFLWRIMHSPVFLTRIAIGAANALLLVMIISRRWKISAHLTGMGGLLGGVIGYAVQTGVIPMNVVCFVLFLSLLLMYARIFLGAHTPEQVSAGYLLGLLAVSLPNLIDYV